MRTLLGARVGRPALLHALREVQKQVGAALERAAAPDGQELLVEDLFGARREPGYVKGETRVRFKQPPQALALEYA